MAADAGVGSDRLAAAGPQESTNTAYTLRTLQARTHALPDCATAQAARASEQASLLPRKLPAVVRAVQTHVAAGAQGQAPGDAQALLAQLAQLPPAQSAMLLQAVGAAAQAAPPAGAEAGGASAGAAGLPAAALQQLAGALQAAPPPEPGAPRPPASAAWAQPGPGPAHAAAHAQQLLQLQAHAAAQAAAFAAAMQAAVSQGGDPAGASSGGLAAGDEKGATAGAARGEPAAPGAGLAAALAALPPPVAAQLRAQPGALPAGLQALLAAGRAGRAAGLPPLSAAAGAPAGPAGLAGLPPLESMPVVLQDAAAAPRSPGEPLPGRRGAGAEAGADIPGPGSALAHAHAGLELPRAPNGRGSPDAHVPSGRRPRQRADVAAAGAEVTSIVRSAAGARTGPGRGGRSRGRGCAPASTRCDVSHRHALGWPSAAVSMWRCVLLRGALLSRLLGLAFETNALPLSAAGAYKARCAGARDIWPSHMQGLACTGRGPAERAAA